MWCLWISSQNNCLVFFLKPSCLGVAIPEEPVVEQQPDAVLPLYLDCSVMKQPQTGEERIVSRKCGEAAESLSTQRSGKRKPHLGSTLDQGEVALVTCRLLLC